MGRPAFTIPLILALSALAAASIAYGVKTAHTDSADLERRAEEVRLFLERDDPYHDVGRDNTYPPSALPVFAAIVPTGAAVARKVLWIGLNLVSLAAVGWLVVSTWGRRWPPWMKAAYCLAVAASKPARAGIALGQFHLIPTALLLGAEAAGQGGRPVVSGVLAGLAMIKPTMAAPYAASMAVRKQWLALGVAVGLQIALVLGTSAWLGLGPVTLIREWLENARSQVALGTIDLPSLLSRAGLRVSAASTSLVALLAATAVLWALRQRSSLGLTSLSLVFAAVMTYHRHYDMVLLLPALAYFLDSSLSPVGWVERGEPDQDRDGGARCARPTLRGTRVECDVASLAFGLVLIAPSHPSVAPIPERLYDAMFLASSYLALMGLIVLVAREPSAKTSTTPTPPEGENQGR